MTSVTPGGQHVIQPLCPGGLQADGAGTWVTVLQGGKAHIAGMNCSSVGREILEKSLLDWNSYLSNLFPNPLPTLFFPYEKVSSKWDVEKVFTVPNLLSSQIAGLWINCP